MLQAVIYPRRLPREEVLLKRGVHDFEYLPSCGTWAHNEGIAEYLVLEVQEL